MSDVTIEVTARTRWWVKPALWFAKGIIGLVARYGVVVSFVLGCPSPSPQPPPQPDADAALLGDASDPCACAHLAAIGCAEGSDPNCVAACNKNAQVPVLSAKSISCWAAAQTKEAARACGGLRCQ